VYGGPLYPAPHRIAPAVFRYGVIFGVVGLAIAVGKTVVQTVRQNIGLSGGSLVLVSCVWFIATLGLLFAAGIMAARETGRLAAGTWAGTIAGVIPAAGIGIIVSLQVLSEPSNSLSARGSAYLVGFGIGILISVALLVLIGGGIGAGLGVLGALWGRAQYRSTHPQAYQAYGAPYPLYPPYGASPTAPPYPGMLPSPYPPYPPYTPYPPYGAYPPPGQYPPSDTHGSQYGQVPDYPPPPPDIPRPSQPGYPPDDTTPGAGWGVPRDTEPPTSR
jgi:hypothetical protein